MLRSTHLPRYRPRAAAIALGLLLALCGGVAEAQSIKARIKAKAARLYNERLYPAAVHFVGSRAGRCIARVVRTVRGTKPPVDGKKPIAEIAPIEDTVVRTASRDNLRKIVEAPLLLPCEMLYDRNILTLMSSANRKDVQGHSEGVGGQAYIDIDYRSLSAENKKLIDTALREGDPQLEHFELHGAKPTPGIKLKVPLDQNAIAAQAQTGAIALVRRLRYQPVGRRRKTPWRPESLQKKVKDLLLVSEAEAGEIVATEGTDEVASWFTSQSGFYDPGRQVLFDSKEAAVKYDPAGHFVDSIKLLGKALAR